MDFEYIIKSDEFRPIIEIKNLKLRSLQDFLNTHCVYSHFEEVINDFKEIYEGFLSIDNLVERKYNGYWQDDVLGNCFTVLGYDNGIDVFINNEFVYIEDEYLYPKVPRVKMEIFKFIQVLEFWKSILKETV